MTVGSPALAGYSLAITRLNSRWLTRQFSNLNFPNKDKIPFAISTLQHIPFTIETSGSLLPSLIVLPQNDRYWKLLEGAAKRTRQWSIPMAMNIVWVLIAFFLTIVDSLVDFDNFINLPGDAGYSVTAAWTYLLPLVVGWLYVGCQTDAGHLRDALNDAHDIAYVATDAEPILATQVTGRSARAIEPSTNHIDHVNADEKKDTPIFNYSRVFIWSQHAEHILKLYQHAAAKAHRRIAVRSGERMAGPADGTILSYYDRIGTEAEVVRYCTEEDEGPIDPNSRNGSPQIPSTPSPPYSTHPPGPSALGSLIAGTYVNADTYAHGHLQSTAFKHDEEAPLAEVLTVPKQPLFTARVLQRVVLATIVGFGLQLCTTGAAILIHINTPPKGTGCRAMTFLIYGVAATVAFALLLFSSMLSHLVRHQSIPEERSGLETFVGYTAALTRWLGKSVAIANGVGILITCTMQFAGTYDSCFCSSTTFGGSPNGIVWFIEGNVKGSEVYMYWISGLAMAFGASGLYSFVVYVVIPMR